MEISWTLIQKYENQKEYNQQLKMQMKITLKCNRTVGPKNPTKRVTHQLELLLKPIGLELTNNITDDRHFLPSERDFEYDLCSCDIESLYTSLPTELGLQAINYCTSKKRFNSRAVFNKCYFRSFRIYFTK